jgi:CRP/FNR family transcriptional regulator, transcriptional activator FtrB
MSLPLFRDMNPANFSTLTQAAFLQRFPPHVVLVREGETPDFLHVVGDGLVELFATHGKHEVGLALLRPTSTFGLAAVMKDAVYLNSVRTLEPSQILMIPVGAARTVFSLDTAFARGVAEELSNSHRDAVKELKNQKLRPSFERLANWLIREATMEGDKGKLTLRIDKRTLAAHVGTTPENLSRNFAMLADHGIEVRGRTITIKSMKALTNFANPSPLIDDPLI